MHRFVSCGASTLRGRLTAAPPALRALSSTAAAEDLVIHEVDQSTRVATVTLNRPKACNALSLALLRALGDTLDKLNRDDMCNVVVLQAAGPVFSSGHDLKEVAVATAGAHGDALACHKTHHELFALCSAVMMKVADLDKPVIAKVNGIATAAGCQLVASCDLVVATPESKFATPGVNIGLFCSTPAVAVARAVGRRHTMEMLLTGDMITAADAYRMGLINRIVSSDELDASVTALALSIAQKSALAIRMGKRAFNQQVHLSVPDAYTLTSLTMADNLIDPDAIEGVGAFLAKRHPHWPSRKPSQ